MSARSFGFIKPSQKFRDNDMANRIRRHQSFFNADTSSITGEDETFSWKMGLTYAQGPEDQFTCKVLQKIVSLLICWAFILYFCCQGKRWGFDKIIRQNENPL